MHHAKKLSTSMCGKLTKDYVFRYTTHVLPFPHKKICTGFTKWFLCTCILYARVSFGLLTWSWNQQSHRIYPEWMPWGGRQNQFSGRFPWCFKRAVTTDWQLLRTDWRKTAAGRNSRVNFIALHKIRSRDEAVCAGCDSLTVEISRPPLGRSEV